MLRWHFGIPYEMRRETTRQMDTTHDFAAVLAAVSRATGVPEAHIFTKRRGQAYYDARWIAVQLLTDLGYYPTQISNITGTSHRNVNKILSAIQERRGCTWRMFNDRLERCRNALGILPKA